MMTFTLSIPMSKQSTALMILLSATYRTPDIETSPANAVILDTTPAWISALPCMSLSLLQLSELDVIFILRELGRWIVQCTYAIPYSLLLSLQSLSAFVTTCRPISALGRQFSVAYTVSQNDHIFIRLNYCNNLVYCRPTFIISDT